MLQLKGNAALIMHVAKGGLSDIPEIVPRLQAGIAVLAGLTHMDQVRVSDVQRIAAQLLDQLIQEGLLRTPAQDLLSYVHLMAFSTAHRREPAMSVDDLLLGGLVCAMRQMRIRAEAGGELLVDWTTALPPGLEHEALLLYKKATTRVVASSAAA